MKNARIILVFLALTVTLTSSLRAQTVERFPKPDFETEYVRPELRTPQPRARAREIIDIFVLLGTLSLASWFVIRDRSRRRTFWLMVFSLIYFGFYRKGCVCSVGAVQNVLYALFNHGYAIPVGVLLFFMLPLVFALFWGRTFCAAVCPLGAVQDAVILKPKKVVPWLDHILSGLPYVYLALGVLFAATGAEFIFCRYDPFVGFFRFGASFNMTLFGVSILILGTVIARPYCRYLCPYGVILGWMSNLSRRHVTITPDYCNECRLCEDSCPFGAIQKPTESLDPPARKKESSRMLLLILMIPVVMVLTGWAGSQLGHPLSKRHYTVSLAHEIRHLDADGLQETSDTMDAFSGSGKTTERLFEEAARIENRFVILGGGLGAFLGLMFMIKMIGLTLHRKREGYHIDKAKCLSCARCVSYCPYEQVRLGNIQPEEVVHGQ